MENKRKRPTKLWIMAIALGLLIAISGVQAVELAGLNEKVSTELSGLSTAKPSSSNGASTTLQNNLQNLPSMVGGC